MKYGFRFPLTTWVVFLCIGITIGVAIGVAIGVTSPSAAQANPVAITPDSGSSKSPQKVKLAGVYVSQFAFDSWYMMRFYTDGVVIGVSVGGIEDICRSWRLIKRWFRRPYPKPVYSQGEYRVSGQTMRFSLISSVGTVDYKGRYKGAQLTLRSYSHINGFRSRQRYHRFETICKN